MGRPTVHDVASAAGVSLATVSIVLNGKPGVGTDARARVLAAAEQLGYRTRGTRPMLGLLVERLPVPAYSDPAVGMMIQGAETEAKRLGYHLVLESIEPGMRDLPAMLTGRQVRGAIVLGSGDTTDAYVRSVAAGDIPIVLADNYVEGLDVPCVVPDNATGASLVTRHLIELGHRRIAFLEGPAKYKTLTERKEGYLRAHVQAGLTPDPSLAIPPLHHGARKGYFETQQLLSLPPSQRPTASFRRE